MNFKPLPSFGWFFYSECKFIAAIAVAITATMIELPFHEFQKHLEDKLKRRVPERTLRYWLTTVTLIGCKDYYTDQDEFWILEWLRFKRHNRSVKAFHDYMKTYAT